MNIKKVHLAYFSPVQTTKRVSLYIGRGISCNVPTVHINNTDLHVREKRHEFSEDELIIIGSPTYGGRLPVVSPSIFDNLYGNNTPAIIYITYGNVGFDDTLLEMYTLLKSKGFIIYGAGAFVTRHVSAQLIGSDRPDKDDFEKAFELGRLSIEKINSDTITELSIPGNVNYKDHPPKSSFTPITNDKCIQCFLCYRWCPTDAIDNKNPNITDSSRCIKCQGCIRRCPTHAREIVEQSFLDRVSAYEEKFKNNNCSSQIFI